MRAGEIVGMDPGRYLRRGIGGAQPQLLQQAPGHAGIRDRAVRTKDAPENEAGKHQRYGLGLFWTLWRSAGIRFVVEKIRQGR
ncbi:MAG TPA: hypothetical protein VMU87_00735 [Stellaceae bacterium]|nr:hypothetical protein [Stellaceae bacterium]